MMLSSTYAFRSVCDITPEFLDSIQVKGLLLDIDNTLTTHDNPVPAKGVTEWVARMKAAGIRMYLVSNNHPPRVQPFAELLGIPFVCESQKPLANGFRRAKEAMGISRQHLCVVGDQLYTDILGANMFRVRSIYVSPIELEQKGFLKFKRKIEKPFLPKKYNEV